MNFQEKEIITKTVRSGLIVLTSIEDQNINQMQVVKQDIDLVAEDSTIDRLRRILRLHKETSACKRSKDESISEYIERFSGHALSYLNLTKADQDSSNSQNFAIVLLLNAKRTT